MPNGLVENGVFELSSLRGGIDDTTAVMALDSDRCTVAENVEFVRTTLGERRRGCTAIDLYAAFEAPALDAVTWMYRHLPTNNEGDAELWALAQSLSSATYVLGRRQIAGWTSITPDDAIDSTLGQGHRLSAQSVHGKLFIAYKSAQDRLHVWDGTYLRRVGLAEPAAPAVANTGVGAFATTRYYRVRYVIVSGTTVVARSEPSDTTTFTPSGAGSAARITKPVTISEHETHWEVEASTDNTDFYRIARVVVGTTTYDDSTVFATGYNTSANTLSADIGDYSLPYSCKFLTVDEDRLLMGGSWEDSAKASRISWTPVFGDPTGSGNDERLEEDTDPFLDLDGFEGGELTGLSRAVNGYIYAFKRSHIYKIVRANSRTQSYEAIPLTKARGALPGSIVEAISQSGDPSIYFLDPSVGPCRLGANGLQWAGRDVQAIWRRVNVNTSVACTGVYYPSSKQLHYWLAVDDATYPNFKIVVHVNEMRDSDEGARRGWVTVTKGNRIATAHCAIMFSDNVDSTTDDRSFALVPFIGKQSWSVSGSTIMDFIQRCDTGGTDAHTSGDTQSAYRGVITSKPFAVGGLLNQLEVKQGSILITASDAPDGEVFVQLIRDFGKETKTVSAEFYTQGLEDYVIAQLDDLNFSELYAMQISLGDLDDSVTPPDTWDLNLLQMRVTSGNTS